MLITGLILAGGRGTRMAGKDKGLQLFQGKTMVTHVMHRLTPQVDTLMISANRNLAVYKALGAPVLPDGVQEFAGPLAGIQAGLTQCKTPYMVTVPCDTPLLPLNLVECLYRALIAEPADLSVALTGGPGSQQPQPLFCLLKTALLPHLTQFLLDGKRKVGAWQEALGATYVNFPEEAAFQNVNSFEDLQKLTFL